MAWDPALNRWSWSPALRPGRAPGPGSGPVPGGRALASACRLRPRTRRWHSIRRRGSCWPPRFPSSGKTVAASRNCGAGTACRGATISVSRQPPEGTGRPGDGLEPGEPADHAVRRWRVDGPVTWRPGTGMAPRGSGPRRTAVAILSGSIVSSETSLLLVGALDENGVVPTSIKVWTWAADGWTPA